VELLILAAVAAILYFKYSGAPGASGETITDFTPDFSGWNMPGTIFGGTAETDDTGELSIMGTIKRWAEIEKQNEGWKPGSKSYRNNNPGNLKPFSSKQLPPGATGTDKDGFLIFSSESAGMAALENDLAAKVRKYPGYSLLEILARYLGGDANHNGVIDPWEIAPNGDVFVNGKLQGNVTSRANRTAAALGVTPNTPIGKIFG
jgi:hypothetical protein